MDFYKVNLMLKNIYRPLRARIDKDRMQASEKLNNLLNKYQVDYTYSAVPAKVIDITPTPLETFF